MVGKVLQGTKPADLPVELSKIFVRWARVIDLDQYELERAGLLSGLNMTSACAADQVDTDLHQGTSISQSGGCTLANSEY